MIQRLLLAALISIVAVACGHNRRATNTVTTRAAFDFQCPAEEIELIVIDEEGLRNLASQIAAHGCEKKAVYVFYPDGDTWMINGSIDPASAEHDPEAYHGKKKNKKEKKADKKANKKADKAAKKADKEAKDLEKPPVD